MDTGERVHIRAMVDRNTSVMFPSILGNIQSWSDSLLEFQYGIMNSPQKGQWRGALMFSLICVWINSWVNNREAGDLRRHRVHYDVIVMELAHTGQYGRFFFLNHQYITRSQMGWGYKTKFPCSAILVIFQWYEILVTCCILHLYLTGVAAA